MRRRLSVLLLPCWVCLACLSAAPAFGVGLGLGDSYAALGILPQPLRLTWNLDAVTVRMLGGSPGFTDDLMLAISQRLRQAGVPVADGSFDPLAEPYVCVDLWARGVTQAEDPSDPQRQLDFEFQVFAPASLLKGVRHKGRIEVWQRGVFGTCGRADLRQQETVFLGLCEAFARDWRAARGLKLPRRSRRRRHPGSAAGGAAVGTAVGTEAGEPTVPIGPLGASGTAR